MARFNTSKTKNNPRRTKNFEGDVAYNVDDSMKLFIVTAAGTLSPRFYEEDYGKSFRRQSYGFHHAWTPETEAKVTKSRVKEIYNLVEKVPNFASDFAPYARNDLYMRTAPLVIVASLADQGRLKKEVVLRVVQRADELTELMAIYQYISGKSELKKLPKQFQKGLAMAFQKFGRYGDNLKEAAYPFSKYNRQGKGSITFLDIMRLTHPAPISDIQSQVFKAIKENNLPSIDTWEAQLSAAGKDADAKRAAWENWIDNDMTYMAALRNIRNVMQAGVSVQHFNKLVNFIGNTEIASKAKQFPFRFFSAYRMINGDPGWHKDGVAGLENVDYARPYNLKGLYNALEAAISISTSGIPGFSYLQDQSILIAGDTSDSMQQPISVNSSVEMYHVALVMGFVLQKAIPNVTVGMFGTHWVPLRPTSNILEGVMDAYQRFGEAGYATHGNKVIEWATDKKIHYDWFMFFSDQQIYGDVEALRGNINHGKSAFETAFNQYKNKINPNAKMVLFSLAGYDTIPIDAVRSDVFVVAGWSDKVFQILGDIVTGGNDFIDQFYQPLQRIT